LRASSPPQTTQPRSLGGFATLANRAGWGLDRAIDNLMTFDVRLRPS